jgi:hypothetical protein
MPNKKSCYLFAAERTYASSEPVENNSTSEAQNSNSKGKQKVVIRHS